MPTTMYVVSHTHWDREWYQTFQQFRLRLVDLVDHLLDIIETDPEFTHFNLDAQTIVLEDYLKIRPQAKERLQKHIRAGRIAVGPWYQLNDEFLTSGESTIRSLLVGHQIAREFGPVQKIGYLPDQFGNLSQMPQIFRGFGIDNSIMGRGYQLAGDRKMEFSWSSPDGSSVTASLMAWWYNNAQYLPDNTDEAVEFVIRLRDTMLPRASVPHLLLMNGVDHLEPKPFIGKIINKINAELEKRGISDRLKHATLTEYMDAVKANAVNLDEFAGELREDRGGACLAGTLSSRMYLKQANHASQVALEQISERLCSFARIDCCAYPYDQLHYAWKLLMENHPHDSICGCSVDQVHDEMTPRFQQTQQVAAEMAERALDCLTGRNRTVGAREDAARITVFNTLNWMRTDPVSVVLEFPLGAPSRGNPARDDSKRVSGFNLIDEKGASMPFAVTANETLVATVTNPHELPLDQWVQRIAIEFVAKDVPPCGYKAYAVRKTNTWTKFPDYSPGAESRLVSEAFMDNQPILEDVGDVGDEYLYRKPLNDVRIVCAADNALFESRSDNAVRARKTVCVNLPIPKTSDITERSKETIDCPIAIASTVWNGVDRVEYRVEVDNRASDHRLRLMWDAGDRGIVNAESQFDVIERPVKHPLEEEGALPFHPQRFWVDSTCVFDDATYGWTVINRGLPEFQVYEEDGDSGSDQRIAVTLLRCVGQLSGRGDGPGIQTPGAQCIGRYAFDLALFEHDEDWKSAKVWKQAHQFNVPLVAVQSSVKGDLWERSYATVSPEEMVVSAIKRAEERDTLIIRFYNTTNDEFEDVVAAIPGAKHCRLVNLNEEPMEEWRTGDTLHMKVTGKKIVTVEFEV